MKNTRSNTHPDDATAEQRVEYEIGSLIKTIQTSSADWIVVSNEVGLGLIPPFPVGRVFRDQLERANQPIAFCADEVFFLVTGIPVPVHQFRISDEKELGG